LGIGFGYTSGRYSKENFLGMFYDILDAKRVEILPLFQSFKGTFYLAGGTGLALQFGHRDSRDFDFFTADHFETDVFYNGLRELLGDRSIVKTLEEKDSLSVVIDEEIRLSFFRYPYALLNPTIDEEHMRIASIEDIACMKLSAIVSRATWKDYIDLYFILQQCSLKDVLKNVAKKMPDLDQNLILKSLVYFADVADENIIFKNNFDVPRKTVETFLEERVKANLG